MPSMELTGLYAKYNGWSFYRGSGAANTSDDSIEFIGSRVPAYICPSDIDIDEKSPSSSNSPSDGRFTAAGSFSPASYVAIGGRGRGTNYGDWWDNSEVTKTTPEWEGVIHVVGSIRRSGNPAKICEPSAFASILDGTSNTTLFAEKHRPIVTDAAQATNARNRRSFWASIGQYHIATVSPYSANLMGTQWEQCMTAAVAHGAGSPGDTFCMRATGSHHQGGLNTARTDGAVGFTSNTIDSLIWANVATKAGGETTSLP